MDPSDDATDSEEAPSPTPKPKKQKKAKASKPTAAPKASRVKPLATAPPAPSNTSEDLSRISKRREKPQKTPAQQLSHALTHAAILRNDLNPLTCLQMKNLVKILWNS